MRNSFLSQVKKTIESHGLLSKKARIVVALSGGADSVALLSALVELGYDCVAAHCNFHLRGEESNRDMRFVESLTRQLGIDLYVREFNVGERIEITGESIEMACRELRYKWFYDLLDREQGQAIAVGHHREDQVETFFLNLFRGSGVAGLAGMRFRNGHVVRPLLDVSRSQIECYLSQKGIGWINDSSNASSEFSRNRIRNEIMPLIRQLFPAAEDSILRSMAFLREDEAAVSSLVKLKIERYVNPASRDIDLAKLIDNEPFPNKILYEILKPEGFNRSQTDDMIRSAQNAGGIFRASETHIRELDHGILRGPQAASPLSEGEHEISLLRTIVDPIRIEISRHNVAEFKSENNPLVAYLDAEILAEPAKWILRRWRNADRMTPYGMTGSKLVSDIFAHAKFSAKQKREAWILTRNGQILWIVGLRASALFSIGPSTRYYLRLEFKPQG